MIDSRAKSISRSICFAAGFIAACGVGRAQAPPSPKSPTPEDIELIRARFKEIKQRRLENEPTEPAVPLRRVARPPKVARELESGALRLDNQMDRLRPVWTFEPIEQPKARGVRVPLCLKGEQWIALEPGCWHVNLVVGRPDESQLLRPPPWEIALEEGGVYTLELTDKLESELKRAMRQAERDRGRRGLEREMKSDTDTDTEPEAGPRRTVIIERRTDK